MSFSPSHDNELDDLFLCYIFRMLSALLMIPVVQKRLDVFRTVVWNSQRIRAQKDTALPDGVPDHIHSFLDMYGLEDCVMVMSHLYMLMHFMHMYSVLTCIHHMPELHEVSLLFCLTQLKCSSMHLNGVFHAAVYFH